MALAEGEATRLGHRELERHTRVRMRRNIALYRRLRYRPTRRVVEHGFERAYLRKGPPPARA